MNQEGRKFTFEDYQGQGIVLYFYPKDNTPGCTLEGQDFNRLLPNFGKENYTVLGISRDSVTSHQKFCDKFSFRFDLISDENESLCKHFDVIKEKNMYGKKVMGIERSTFIFNPKHELVKSYRKVKAEGHAEDVLSDIKSL